MWLLDADSIASVASCWIFLYALFCVLKYKALMYNVSSKYLQQRTDHTFCSYFLLVLGTLLERTSRNVVKCNHG